MAKKYFTKALSVGLSLVLCAGMVAPAFAAEEPETEPVPVASVTYTNENGETVTDQYNSIQEAVEAAGTNTATIQLLENVEDVDNVRIPEGADLTLDLNGKSWSASWQNEDGGRHNYAIDNYGSLIIKDSAGGGEITARGVQNKSGTLTINGGTFCSIDANGGASVWNEANLVINGGTFKTTYEGSPGDQYGAGCVNNRGTALITGGTFDSVNRRTYAVSSAGDKITITPGEGKEVIVKGAHGGLAIDGGAAEVNGGSYESTDYYGLYVSNDARTAGVLVNGGEFTGKVYSVWIGSDINNPVDSEIDITDGVFNNPLNVQDNAAESAIEVSGGSYKKEVAEPMLALQVVCIKVESEEDAMYQVGYLTVEDDKTGDTLYTNMGTGSTAMSPTLNLNKDKVVDDETVTTTTQVTNTKYTNVIWSSGDESVATVGEDGQIQAVGNGRVTITATYEVNGKTVTKDYTITVETAYIPIYTTATTPTDTEIDAPAIPLAAGPVTRAEFIDYLWRHEGEPETDGVCTFTDVPEDHEYVLALGWAQANGLILGNEINEFMPDELVTVSAVRTILTRCAAWKGMAMPELTTLTGADDEAVLNCDEVLAEFFGEELADQAA